MPFQMFNKKAFPDRGVPAPGSTPISPGRRWMGTEALSPGACFQCSKSSHGAEKELFYTSTAAKTLYRLWTSRTLGD